MCIARFCRGELGGERRYIYVLWVCRPSFIRVCVGCERERSVNVCITLFGDVVVMLKSERIEKELRFSIEWFIRLRFGKVYYFV